jgi:transcriptional regulator GlxA family with amidase domain
MHVAIVTFDGFSEIDTFIALGLLNRLEDNGWRAELASPAAYVTSTNGVTVQAQRPLEFANDADVVLFGSNMYARALSSNSALLDRLTLDPLRQTIGAVGSGALLLARLGLLGAMAACAEPAVRPWLIEAGVRAVDEPFNARGPVATAGGRLATVYLAAWVIARSAGIDAAASALRHAAPVGDEDRFVAQVLDALRPYLPGAGH